MENKPNENLYFKSNKEISNSIYRISNAKYNNVFIKGNIQQMDHQIKNDENLNKFYGGMIVTPKNNKMLTFYNPYFNPAMKEAHVVSSDGTFKCVPHKFYQLLTVFTT